MTPYILNKDPKSQEQESEQSRRHRGREALPSSVCHIVTGSRAAGYNTMQDMERGHVHKTSAQAVSDVHCGLHSKVGCYRCCAVRRCSSPLTEPILEITLHHQRVCTGQSSAHSLCVLLHLLRFGERVPHRCEVLVRENPPSRQRLLKKTTSMLLGLRPEAGV